MTQSGNGRGPATARPWWLGLAVSAVGAVWLYEGLTLPQTAQYAAIGPGMFVTSIGLGLLLLGSILLWQIRAGERFEPQDSEDADAAAPAAKRPLALAIAASALPLLTMRHVGFPITATICFALVARAYESQNLARDLGIGALLSCLAWFGFRLLGVTLGGFLPLAGI
jgi:putative tricarboxylic transport membrane protein